MRHMHGTRRHDDLHAATEPADVQLAYKMSAADSILVSPLKPCFDVLCALCDVLYCLCLEAQVPEFALLCFTSAEGVLRFACVALVALCCIALPGFALLDMVLLCPSCFCCYLCMV